MKTTDTIYNEQFSRELTPRGNAIKAMEVYGKQMYNQALQDALKEARCAYKGDLFTGDVDPDSILQLLKP